MKLIFYSELSDNNYLRARQSAEMNMSEKETVEKVLLDAQKAMLYPVMEAVVAYLKENHHPETTVTAMELCEKVLGMESSITVGIAIHTHSSSKKNERDIVNGCQRIMGGRSPTKAHEPCGDPVYKDIATGQKAKFCSKCMKLVSFRAQVLPLLVQWDMSLSEATAGKMRGDTPVRRLLPGYEGESLEHDVTPRQSSPLRNEIHSAQPEPESSLLSQNTPPAQGMPARIPGAPYTHRMMAPQRRQLVFPPN